MIVCNTERQLHSWQLRVIIQRMLRDEVLGKADTLAIQKAAYKAYLRGEPIDESHLDLPHLKESSK